MSKVWITLEVEYDETCQNHPAAWDWSALCDAAVNVVDDEVVA